MLFRAALGCMLVLRAGEIRAAGVIFVLPCLLRVNLHRLFLGRTFCQQQAFYFLSRRGLGEAFDLRFVQFASKKIMLIHYSTNGLFNFLGEQEGIFG